MYENKDEMMMMMLQEGTNIPILNKISQLNIYI